MPFVKEKRENKQLVLRRVPPGDRWTEADGRPDIYNSLTDALNAIFEKTGITDYYIAAREGCVYSVSEVEVEIAMPKPTPPKKFSIYDD